MNPIRVMPDGTGCWCVSREEPHEGWVHAPACLEQRRRFVGLYFTDGPDGDQPGPRLTGAERIGVEVALLPPRGGDPMWLLNAMARLGAMPDPGAVGPTIRDLEVAGAMVAAEIDRRLEEGDDA